MRYLILFLLASVTLFSQSKSCKYEIEEKTDSTSLRILKEQLFSEKVFGSKKELIQATLLNNNGIPTLGLQIVEKNTIFIPTKCLNRSSKVILQLENGKIVTLLSINEDICSALSYIEEDKANIRILNAYFVFTKQNYDELKSSPVSLMRIQFSGESQDYIIKKEIQSELLKETFYPSRLFMDYLTCIE
ncbi:hypothetical protein NHF50_14060 [Flavobacterium sp. NRK F10]|uniref:hypothetical protein n=1 Tax=Flavobacterium sp. NRK F10 TaxID=2954931 RepID=UPI00209114EF|nr:hypothetical protein [Flavobacterium sp. NRK F10]MCO6176170.1 hypothetical protein [Flavobacterium sp. NRK F10]